MPSWVYILTNKGAPGLLKIGFTDRAPELRAQELGATGLPFPYVVAYALQVFNGRAVERQVHASLRKHHVGKEWFSCTLAFARHIIDDVAGFSVSTSSPLVPGHALEHFFSDEPYIQGTHATSRTLAVDDEPDDSPYPPGHPMRGLL